LTSSGVILAGVSFEDSASSPSKSGLSRDWHRPQVSIFDLLSLDQLTEFAHSMHITQLAPEIILGIFQNCATIADVANLSLSCRRFHSMLSTSQRTLILYSAAESEFGPVLDILQLLTLNDSQLAHCIRDPPRSDFLLKQVITVGRVAQRWEEIYPFWKWNSDFADRRFLSGHERYRLRRAVYRYWLYTYAFHTPAYPRSSRRIPQVLYQRAKLLQKWSTRELIEINDFQITMRALISSSVYPSDPGMHAIFLSEGETIQTFDPKQIPTIVAQDYFHHSGVAHGLDGTATKQVDDLIGWGDPVTHYYILEDLLKLDPKSILWLYDHPRKWQVEGYLDSLGDWFYNNGNTFSETLTYVLEGRDSDLDSKDDVSSFGIIE
jgi:hypothetical protein